MKFRFLCRFWHAWRDGGESPALRGREFNYDKEAPRFRQYGHDQHTFKRSCKRCDRTEYQRIDMLGFVWWSAPGELFFVSKLEDVR